MKIRVPLFWSDYEIKGHRPANEPKAGAEQYALGLLKIKRKDPRPHGGVSLAAPQLALPNLRDVPHAAAGVVPAPESFFGQVLADKGIDPRTLETPVVPPVAPPVVPPPQVASVQPAPKMIARWPTRGADAVNGQIRVAFRALRGGAPPGAFVPMAKAVAAVLPKLDDATLRNNAMSWLDAFLSTGRKAASGDPAERAAIMTQQAPVWQALIDQLPALRDDRTTQFAILYRLQRETDGPPDPRLYAPLQTVAQRLVAMIHGTGESAPVLGANSQDIARVLLKRLGVAAPPEPAPAAGSVEAAIASLPPLTPEEAALYRKSIAETLEKLQKDDRDIRPAILYSLGKHTPGLDPKLFDAIPQIARFLKEFPSQPEHVFGIVSRGTNHANAVRIKEARDDEGVRRHALWFTDTTAGLYNAVIDREFRELLPDMPGKARSLISELGIQEDGWSCGVMSMSLLAESFFHYEKTDAMLNQLLGDGRIADSYVPDESPHTEILAGKLALEGLSADEAKHMQDKKSLSKLGMMMASAPALKDTIVNKKGMTVEQRYRSPGNLKRIAAKDEVHSMSVANTLTRWRERAIRDLRELQSQGDGGAAAWRQACIRIAPIRLEDGSVTDRVVGIELHGKERERRLLELEHVEEGMRASHWAYSAEGRDRIRKTKDHFDALLLRDT